LLGSEAPLLPFRDSLYVELRPHLASL